MGNTKFLLAKLDKITIWPYSYGVIIAIGLGFFFAFFDIITIGLALPTLIKQFNTTLNTAIWCITSSLIGYIVGSLLDSLLSDKFGRRLALILSMLFFSIGSFASAFSPNIYFLIALRFIIGMGIGAEIANVTAYIGELSPPSVRGKYSSIVVSVGFLGFALVPFIGLLLIPNFTFGWRIMFAIGGLGSIIVLFSRRYIPQSARWHLSKGHIKQAEDIIIKAELVAEKRLGKKLPKIKKYLCNNQDKNVTDNPTRLLYLKRIMLFSLIWLTYYLGNYAWLTLNTKLFLFEGYNLSHSLILVSVSSLGFIIGSIIAIYWSDKFERKYSLSLSAIIWSISLLIIAWFSNIYTIMIFGFTASITIAYFIPIMYTLTGEHFPTTFRATGISITDGIGHLGGAFCGQIILGVYFFFETNGYGINMAFTTMAITGFVTAALVLLSQKMTQKQLIQ